jgi:uncharacterized protein involved in exopolysaccharide biosynthesis
MDVRPLLSVWWRHRWLLAVTTVLATLLTLGITLMLPDWFRATAVILPPEESDLAANMSLAQRALTKFPSFGILSDYFTPADIFKAILSSRTVEEEVIRAHDLQNVYHQPSLEKTIKILRSNTKVKLNPDGTIAISVEDRDRHRAAAMANTFLEALDRYNVEKRNTQAHRTRLFLEGRVRDTDSTLRASEEMLRNYEESHHTVTPPTASSSSADVRGSADLMARKIYLEVHLGVLRSYLREDNEEVVQTRVELEQLKDKIGNLPALETELARLMRDAKIQEQLYLLLTSELEQARIRETMDTPTVQVLDPAMPPERHSKPRRLALSLAAGILAFVACAGWLALREPPANLREA